MPHVVNQCQSPMNLSASFCFPICSWLYTGLRLHSWPCFPSFLTYSLPDYVLPQFFTNVSSPLPFCHYFPLYFCWFFSFSLFSSPVSTLFCLQCALPICLPTFLSTFPFLFPFLVVLVSAKFSCFTGKLKVVLSVCMGC